MAGRFGSIAKEPTATLGHRGVLFLDELPEFERGALEALRQPLEDGSVRVTRVRYALELPCLIQLIAAANPCPCGCGPRSGDCTCDPAAVRAYEAKLTGALADRIDISALVSQPDLTSFAEPGERSATVRERVLVARERQRARTGDDRANGELAADEIEIDDPVERMLARAGLAVGLSGRGRERVIRLARTLADLDGRDRVQTGHVEEALSLRRRDGR
jgi:magnesium chelatase family protein